MGIEVFKKHIKEQRAVVVSCATNNTDLIKIKKIAKAAQASKASTIDFSANKTAFNVIKKYSKLPTMACSYHPFQLFEAVKWGVDAIRIGNYESAYKKGKLFNIDEIYDICLETMGLLNKYEIFTCATIPGYIGIEEQIKLSKKLEILGVDLIQTEGYNKTANKLISDPQITIDNTFNLSNNTRIPVMSATGMNTKTAPLAFSSGASAVMLGSAVNKLDSEVQMSTTIMTIVNSVSHRNSIHKEIIRTEREMLNI